MGPWVCTACGSGNQPTHEKCPSCGAPRGAAPARPQYTPPPQARGPYPAQPGQRPPGGSGLGKLVLLGCAAMVLFGACCMAFAIWGAQTHTGLASVASRSWERTISVKAIQEVREESADPPPIGARDVKKEHNLKLFVDKRGNQIEKYEDKYSYTVDREVVVRTEKAAGADEAPAWPPLKLAEGEKEGGRAEKYTVRFQVGPGATAVLEPTDASEFGKYTTGSQWNVEWNNLDRVTKVLGPAAGSTAPVGSAN